MISTIYLTLNKAVKTRIFFDFQDALSKFLFLQTEVSLQTRSLFRRTTKQKQILEMKKKKKQGSFFW
jgi:hypothetical protein